jgi:hypothetical protein
MTVEQCARELPGPQRRNNLAPDGLQRQRSRADWSADRLAWRIGNGESTPHYPFMPPPGFG